ncbi:hypothetical protein BP6252_05456 [Coleophoma cylindrospora]|uniref:Tim44-like domain-containing protein n=1 Tax=Coleophoma cylindrospora TaxID=1849047 RepID=A0A3D8RTN1_9HELO|nr:hypothetical protein BP6252_05456 [Coleophoma cylindrospora]
MAQSLRRPVLSVVGLVPSIPSAIQYRYFSQVAPRWAVAQPGAARAAQSPERSLKVASKENMQIPSDLGLLPGTFITPSGSKRPSLFQDPKGLFKLQWWRLRFRVRDVFSSLVLVWSSPRKESWYRRMVKINRSQIAPSAVALHQTMYTAFAEGDTTTLRKICTDGIHDSFRARIASRPRGEKTAWEIVRYNKRAKLMSNRAARLPLDGWAVRQAVVRISSRQKLTRYRANGTIVPGTGKEKDVVEYVVIQKMYSGWKDQEWKVWGTTDVTTLGDLEAELNKDL